MARIDIKGISKLQDKLKASAIAYSEASEKAWKASKASKSLRVAEENEAFNRMLLDAIGLVAALATADDGKGKGPTRDLKPWLVDIETNADIYARVFALLKAEPYARVFAAAEKAARR